MNATILIDPAAIAVKGGAMLTTSSILADAVIFSDISYLYLAFVGAIVSMFGVAHEIFGSGHKQYSLSETIMELIKGTALGVLAIPFWYTIIHGFGDDIVMSVFKVTCDADIHTSLSLIIAFGMAWFTVPVFDFIAKTIPETIKSYVVRLARKDV